jgi:hypothetical protein
MWVATGDSSRSRHRLETRAPLPKWRRPGHHFSAVRARPNVGRAPRQRRAADPAPWQSRSRRPWDGRSSSPRGGESSTQRGSRQEVLALTTQTRDSCITAEMASAWPSLPSGESATQRGSRPAPTARRRSGAVAKSVASTARWVVLALTTRAETGVAVAIASAWSHAFSGESATQRGSRPARR